MKKLLLAALALLPLTLPAQAQFGVKLGLLTCTIAGGSGFIVGSSKDMHCTFYPAFANLPQETYSGRINKYGIDVGATSGAVLQWYVLAPSQEVLAPHVLAGDYFGASAEATVAVGLGAHLLVGGGPQSIALQPLSVQAQTGLNMALAVGALQLVSAAQ